MTAGILAAIPWLFVAAIAGLSAIYDTQYWVVAALSVAVAVVLARGIGGPWAALVSGLLGLGLVLVALQPTTQYNVEITVVIGAAIVLTSAYAFWVAWTARTSRSS